MNGQAKKQQDWAIQEAISGTEFPDPPGISIVEDYFKREWEENRKEAGYPVRLDPDAARTELEVEVWKHDKALSELESERVNRKMPEYPGNDEEFIPLLVNKIIIVV